MSKLCTSSNLHRIKIPLQSQGQTPRCWFLMKQSWLWLKIRWSTWGALTNENNCDLIWKQNSVMNRNTQSFVSLLCHIMSKHSFMMYSALIRQIIIITLSCEQLQKYILAKCKAADSAPCEKHFVTQKTVCSVFTCVKHVSDGLGKPFGRCSVSGFHQNWVMTITISLHLEKNKFSIFYQKLCRNGFI